MKMRNASSKHKLELEISSRFQALQRCHGKISNVNKNLTRLSDQAFKVLAMYDPESEWTFNNLKEYSNKSMDVRMCYSHYREEAAKYQRLINSHTEKVNRLVELLIAWREIGLGQRGYKEQDLKVIDNVAKANSVFDNLISIRLSALSA